MGTVHELRRPAAAVHDHVVTFYESEDFLVDGVADFLAPALGVDAPAIVVATKEHRVAIERALAARGLLTDRYVAVDAHEALMRFMRDGDVDLAAFRELVDGLLGKTGDGRGDARVFGEMVALLWEQGDVAGAIALEDAWNDLLSVRRFALFCGYPLRSFARDEDSEAFGAICDRHSAVTPGESFSSLEDPEAQRRMVALLQHETTAGAAERNLLREKQGELEETLTRLRELERVRSEFVAMVVHDIRSPAAIASAYLDLLTDDGSAIEPDEVEEVLEKAKESLARIERLVEDILTMSRVDSGEFTFDLRPADLGGIVERTASQMRDRTGRMISVERPRVLGPALVDEDRQVQILTNLLANATKFSPPDSSIRVTVTESGDRIVVSVGDEGPGIAPEDQEQLFRPFSRLDGDRVGDEHGTGLGLYIARALVEGQGGSIWVDSDEGPGATFSYTVRPATGGD